MASNENTIRCKGRTAARSYMKAKPVKFGIRLYENVEWKSRYVHTLWDNGSGNKTGIPPGTEYVTEFKEIRGPLDRTMDESLVPSQRVYVLWALQMTHATRTLPDPKFRMVVKDNFYTRHVLVEQANHLSYYELCFLGTVRMNNIDGVNIPAVHTADDELEEAPRGSWSLFQMYQKHIVSGTMRKRVRQQPKYCDTAPSVLDNAGYVVWKDLKDVVFY